MERKNHNLYEEKVLLVKHYFEQKFVAPFSWRRRVGDEVQQANFFSEIKKIKYG